MFELIFKKINKTIRFDFKITSLALQIEQMVQCFQVWNQTHHDSFLLRLVRYGDFDGAIADGEEGGVALGDCGIEAGIGKLRPGSAATVPFSVAVQCYLDHCGPS